MKKLMLLTAAGALWLFLAAVPAFADGGPHVTAANSGVSTLTADSCAGCHRAHTASGEYLINKATEEELCLGCHGAAGVGATTDVMTGVQYTLANDGNGQPIAGALRAGGFDQARIGDVGRLDTGTRYSSKVVVDTTIDAGNDVTSAHIAMTDNGLNNPHIAWGSGANNSGAGQATVTLSCASCHNPHGNGQYRILTPTPNAGGIAFATFGIARIDAASDIIFTTSGHEFQVGDVVKFNGVTQLAGTSYVVVAIPNGVQLQIGTLTAGGNATVTALTDTGAVGTVQRYQTPVTDAPLGTPDGNGIYPTRNYTVIQTKGTQGTDTTYMLYLSDVTGASGGTFNGIAGTYTAAGGDYWHRAVPWNGVAGTSRSISGVAAGVITTTAAHGFSVGSVVTISNLTGVAGIGSTTFVVATVPSTTTFTIAGGTPSDATYVTGAYPSAVLATTQDDAPNGQPVTNPGHAVGDVAFNIQITAWCTSCHTRYYANQNANPTGTAEGSSPASSKTLTAVAGGVISSWGHGFLVGDVVTVASLAGVVDGDYTVATVPSSSTFTLAGQTPTNGTGLTATAIRSSAPQAQSSWFFERNVAGTADETYKFQHRTIPNRACTTCHVAHGSNKDMTGTFSSTFTTPAGAASASSRLLKADNRGTCQACHDPTNTWATANATGTYIGAAGGNVVP